MRPVLFQVFSLPVYSYHAAALVGALLMILATDHEIRRLRLDLRRMRFLMLLVFVASLLGARAVHVLLHLDAYQDRPLLAPVFWRGGMSSYGLVLFSAPVFLWYVRRQGLDGWKAADAFSPGIALFIAVMRVGCFLAGCCHGRPCSPGFPLAVRLPDPLPGIPPGTPAHPFQLYAAAAALVLFLILWHLRTRKRFRGQLALLSVIYYPACLCVLEFLRGDVRPTLALVGHPVPVLLLIALPLLPAALLIYWRKSVSAARQATAAPR